MDSASATAQNSVAKRCEPSRDDLSIEDEKQQLDQEQAERGDYAYELDNEDKPGAVNQFRTEGMTLRKAWYQRLKRSQKIHVDASGGADALKGLKDLLRSELPYVPQTIKDELEEAINNFEAPPSTITCTITSSDLSLSNKNTSELTLSLSNKNTSELTLEQMLRELTENERTLVEKLSDKATQRDFAQQFLIKDERAERAEREKRLIEERAEKEKRLIEERAEKEKRLIEERAERAEREKRLIEERAEKEKRLNNSIRSLCSVVGEILENVTEIDNTLRYLGGLSQEGRTASQTDATPGKASFAELLAKEDNGEDMKNLVGDESLYTNLLNNAVKKVKLLDLFPEWDSYTKNNDNDTKSYQQLQQLSKDWNDFIQKSKILIDKPQSTNKKQKTLQSKHKSQGGAAKITEGNTAENGHDNKDGFLAPVAATEYKEFVLQSLCSWNSSNPTSNMYFPGAVSHEKDGVQPVLDVFFREIAKCHSESKRAATLSPPKAKVQSEVVIPPQKPGRAARFVDYTFTKEGRFQAAMLDQNLQPSVEVKNEMRKLQTATSLRNESARQAMGHMAKFLYYYFNLLGVGLETYATALSGTALHVTLYRLDLRMQEHQNETCPMARLSLQCYGPFPLVTVESFDRVVASVDNSLSDLRTTLYGVNGKGGLDKRGIPLGMRLYWYIMSLPRESLFGPKSEVFNFSQIGSQKIDFGPVLGNGSFGFIVAEKQESGQGYILKVATSPSRKHHDSEKNVLSFIKDQNNKPITLPEWVEGVKVKMRLGGVERMQQAMILQPLGIPLLEYLSQKDNVSIAEMVTRDVSEALQFLHKLKICHNDISPKNVVIATNEGRDHAVLVDFGIATFENDDLQGVQGTPLYIHRSVFKKYLRHSWKPCAEFDCTALGFTVAAVLKGGSPPWTVRPFPCGNGSKLQEVMQRRYNMALDIVEQAESKRYGRMWKYLINLDKMMKAAAV